MVRREAALEMERQTDRQTDMSSQERAESEVAMHRAWQSSKLQPGGQARGRHPGTSRCSWKDPYVWRMGSGLCPHRGGGSLPLQVTAVDVSGAEKGVRKMHVGSSAD